MLWDEFEVIELEISRFCMWEVCDLCGQMEDCERLHVPMMAGKVLSYMLLRIIIFLSTGKVCLLF
jgi:hypothetical protein